MDKNILLNLIPVNGIKATELAVKFVVDNTDYSFKEYDNAITELINDGSIVEKEYTDPNVPYRVKSIYFKVQ